MKARYFFVVAIMLTLVSIVSLRSNHQQAMELRSQILASDSAGEDVADKLAALRNFVFTHMNSSTKLELTASYERAVASAQQATQSNVSGDVYQQAQAACGQDVGTNSVAQVQCVQNFLNQHLQSGSNPQPLELPDRSLYNYVFASPSWTADLAGLTLLGALVSAIVALVIYVRKSFSPT